MGEVHLARDLALGRHAAIKILPADFDSAHRSRLLEEARISARLQHPAIATFFEAGEHDGTAFIAMEYVTGETLRDRLRRGPLPASEALGIVASILEGLVHAHALGVLHRDIKPENVMVAAPGFGRLLDFGIAKELPRDGALAAEAETALTEAGMLLGTPGYVSPEQWQGRAADERSDLFAVGATLYEALAGRRAFEGATPAEALARLLASPAPSLEPRGAPAGVDALLARALAKNPDERFQTASQFLQALQALQVLEGTVSGARVSATPDTVAVVDLENGSGNPADAWIGSAVAEQLTGDLARVAGLQVVARERVLRTLTARGAARGAESGAPLDDPLERAHRLGCRWLVSGSFQRMGAALRLSARLTEVPTARVIASERLDGTVDEIFALQDRLAAAAVRMFPLGLREAAAGRPREAPNIDAYELHATGMRLFHRLQKGGFGEAKQLFERAIAADPRFAPPHGGLAAIHAMQFTFTTDRRELELAEAYARRAIELDPSSGAPYPWLAYACWRTGRIEESLAAAAEAARLAPTSAYGRYFAGCALSSVGRREEAMVELQATVAIDAQHGFGWMALGMLLSDLGRLEEAEWCLRNAIALEGKPGPSPTIGAAGMLAEIHRRGGRLVEARREALAGIAAAESSDHMYRDSMRVVGLVNLGTIAVEQGDSEAAAAAIAQAIAHLKGRPRTLGGRYLLARALAGLARAGDGDAALERGVAALEGEAYDASWLWCATRGHALEALAAAADALGRPDRAASLRALGETG
jgi:serine/threonine-protein kinase